MNVKIKSMGYMVEFTVDEDDIVEIQRLENTAKENWNKDRAEEIIMKFGRLVYYAVATRKR